MSDLQALALVKSIRFAAVMIGVSMILLGLMVWQPWGGSDEPRAVTVSRESESTRTSGGVTTFQPGFTENCVRLGDNITCNWPK